MKELLTGNKAAAYGAKLAKVKVVPSYPITPQTEIIETIAEWIAKNEMRCEFIPCESEHSALSAAIGSEACGLRTFTATSSQGLLLMHEMLYIASGMRLPIAMVNVSRALSAPITLWPDHNDVLDQRDSGWIVLFCENNQEVLDTILQAYRLGEDQRVSLPCLVNMEGYILSYTREPVEIPSQSSVDEFLPEYQPLTLLDPDQPMSLGVPAEAEDYARFKLQQHAACLNALKVSNEVFKDFEKIFGRSYDVIESFKLEDAKLALISVGASSTLAKSACLEARRKGIKVGLLRLRLYRPFPEEQIRRSLEQVEAIGVIDQNLAPGATGILWPEIRACLYEYDQFINDYVLGLGGQPITKKDFSAIIKDLFKTLKKGKSKVKFLIK